MNLDHFVLDADTLLALGGNKQVSGLVHAASEDSFVRLWVPVVCALEAERVRSGTIDCIGILDTLHTLEADYKTAHAVAELHRRGVPCGVAGAVHAARLGPGERSAHHILVSVCIHCQHAIAWNGIGNPYTLGV